MKKILLAEHDAFLINIYIKEFRKLGYSTSVALDGETVIKRIKNISPDLLVLDAALPKIDGFSVLKTLRKDFGLKDLKILMLSNFNHQQEFKNELLVGPVKYFLKAENTSGELAKEIKRILN